MYSAAIIVAAILYIQQFLLVTALPTGEYGDYEDDVCITLRPGHLHNQQPMKPFPYLVKISNIVDDEYIPGYNYTITLRGTQSTRIFRGFLILAKNATNSNSSVGTFWVKSSSARAKYQPICNNTAATHVDNRRKRKVKLRWTAPPAGTGPIRLWYTFVQIHRPQELQSIFWAAVKSNVINEFKNCTVKGQIKMDCAVDERCAYTCDNRNNSIQCPFPCVIKGCQCPEGQVVNELINECVEPAKCPAKCPVEGQKRTRCVPENCTQTCDNKNEFIQCPMDCNAFGCQCPQGTVVNTLINQCVQPDKCPAKCPIAGQVRKICAIPENCTRTCDNLKEAITCQEICTPFGCECPNGTVVNRITKECVKPEKCPLNEACPFECSYENCRRKKRNVRCSIPNDSGFDTSCLDNCNTAFCVASYYATGTRIPPESCTPCDDPTDMNCLFNWSKCVRRADRATYDSGIKKQNPEDFKYYIHPC